VAISTEESETELPHGKNQAPPRGNTLERVDKFLEKKNTISNSEQKPNCLFHFKSCIPHFINFRNLSISQFGALFHF
jgi:hypothetical protein